MSPSMFPHTVTVYNTVTETDTSTMQTLKTHFMTLLTGVCLAPVDASKAQANGRNSADTATLYIPLYDGIMKATDALTGTEKKFCGPAEFKAAEDKGNLWTLEPGRDTFFVKGNVVEPDKSYQDIRQTHDFVFEVTSVNLYDMGGIPNIEVGGK